MIDTRIASGTAKIKVFSLERLQKLFICEEFFVREEMGGKACVLRCVLYLYIVVLLVSFG